MIKHLRIPDPCQQQWNGMKPQENGRYCGSCKKTVIDFTGKSDREIIDYFAAHAGKKTCGTFKAGQLAAPSPIRHSENRRKVTFVAALLLVFGMSLFSCHTDDTASGQQFQKQAAEETHTMGIPFPMDRSEIPADTNKPVVALTIFTPPVVTDDPVAPDELEPAGAPPANADTSHADSTLVLGAVYNEMPVFGESEHALYEYMSKNLHYIPDEDMQGTVYITFKVKADGCVDSARILRGLTPAADAEALRVVQNMPKWKPAVSNGKAIDVTFNLPVKFRYR